MNKHLRTLLLCGVLVVGEASTRAQAPLTADPSFQLYLTPEWLDQFGSFFVSDMALRENGDILIAGHNISAPDVLPSSVGAALIDHTGDFVPSSFQFMPRGRIQELPDGRYFVGNSRYFADGIRDASFDVGVNDDDQSDTTWNMANSDAYAFADGSVLFVGGCVKRDPDGQLLGTYGLFKVDATGRIDQTYQHRRIGSQVELIHRIRPLNNGQYLLSGYFSSYDGEEVGCCIRVNGDGSRDTSFNFPAGVGVAETMYEQADGKLILGGEFRLDQVPDTVKVIRVNTDGSLDGSFNNLTSYRVSSSTWGGLFSVVSVVERLDEERFLVGGVFLTVNGEPRGSIACVDTLGNLLDCWAGGGLVPEEVSPSGWPSVSLYGYRKLTNGDHYIWGQYAGFIDADGLHPEQVLITRLHGPDVGVVEGAVSRTGIRVHPNPGTERLFVQMQDPYTKGSKRIRLLDALGRDVKSMRMSGAQAVLDVSGLSGVFMVVVEGDGVRSTERVIIN